MRYSKSLQKVPGYKCNRKDRTSSKMVLVQENFAHEPIAIPSVAFTETVGIKLKSGNRTTTLICLYNPPQNNLELGLLHILLALSGDVIVAEDFDARHRFWNCERENHSGKVLYNLVMTRWLSTLPFSYIS